MTIFAARWTAASIAAACVMATVCVMTAGCSRNCATCAPAVTREMPLTCGNADDATFARIVNTIGRAPQAPRFLMLSGGGSYGAWGAGVLNGWSARENGQRPRFELVTGSSTGAILGTWAFLGSEADASAKCAYTDTADNDVYDPALLSWIWLQPWRWGSIKPWVSLKNLGPLRDLFRKYTTMEQVEKVGAIYRDEGRVFLVGTVDLDLGAFCIWDMGRIAEEMIGASAEKKQQVYDRYMEIVMASSSNPGIFDPTFIPSRIDGDMHVDGGVRHQIFFLPSVAKAIGDGLALWQRAASTAKPAASIPGAGGDRKTTAPTTDAGGTGDPPSSACNASDDGSTPRMYAIVNLPSVVPRLCTGNDIYHIAQRSLTVLTIQSLIGDLHQAREQWEKMVGGGQPGEFCVSRIPEDVPTWPFADDFPECEMRELYAKAEQKALSAAPWEEAIPIGGPSPLPCGHSDEPKGEKCSAQAPGCE